MPQGQDQDAKQAAVPITTTPEPAVPAETAAPAVPAVPATTFTSAGKIPPVAASAAATTAAAPTASQMAYGAGVQALTALIAKGKPDPKAVVELLDAHRSEHDAMMSLLDQKLGASYVTEVQGAMGLRASVARKEVVAGDPANPKADSFIASAADQDVKWRAANGNFTGTIDKTGLDTSVAVDPNDTLHANVKAADKSGTLDWNHDGKTEAELYGSYKDPKDYDAGVRRTWGVGSGQLTTALDHSVANGTATDAAIANYKSGDGKTTAKGEVGVSNGKPIGSAQFQTAPTANSTVSANVAHDAKGNTTGQVAGTYQVDPSTKLDANVTRAANSTSVNADASEKLSSAWSLSEKASETIPDSGKPTTTGSVAATYKEGTTTADGSITRNANNTALHADGSEQLSSKWNLNEKLDLSVPDSGKPTATGSVGATYKDGTTTANGSITRNANNTALHADGSEQIDSKWKVNEKLDLTLPDSGKPQLVGSVGESYSSGNLAESANVEGGVGPNQYIKATGEVDEGLGNGFYASQWGSFSAQEGKQNMAQAGASITFTPDEKNALTLAGLVDQNGAIETRLQYDIFKSKIDSVSGLSDAKKNALVSLFVSYRNDPGNRVLDDRFGAPDLDTGAGQQVTAGIRITF